MSTTEQARLRDVRRQLTERIRSDRAFAEAMIEDPDVALGGTDLGAQIAALASDDEVKGYRADNSNNCCAFSFY